MGWQLSLGLMMGLLPGAALAQGWGLSTDRVDAGVLASLRLPQNAAVFHCGVVETDETSIYEMVEFSGPGYVNFVVSDALFGAYSAEHWEQTTVQAEVMGQSIPLPAFAYDETGGSGWVARLPNDHPFVRAAIEGNDITIRPDLAPAFLLERSALSIGLLDMIDHCATARPAAAAQPVPSPLRTRAEAQFAALCNGTYRIAEDAFSTLDVTGDGVDDLVVDFSSLKCTSGMITALERPACDNLMCRHDIYTASVADPLILATFRLAPVADRPGDIHLILDPDSCAYMALEAGCKARMRWMNNTFGTLRME
jgi:hypothetical protein